MAETRLLLAANLFRRSDWRGHWNCGVPTRCIALVVARDSGGLLPWCVPTPSGLSPMGTEVSAMRSNNPVNTDARAGAVLCNPRWACAGHRER